eukprot:scaffold5817_cov101-Cylindrotheca_fusiformis.AAC.1
MSILEPNGGTSRLNTYPGHSFFVTRHGVKEGLHDPETDDQYRFTVATTMDSTTTTNHFVIPENAAPSNNPCQDRFSVCATEAARGA